VAGDEGFGVFLVGFGNVGREAARLVLEGYGGVPARLVGAANSRGVVVVGGPADLVHMARILERGGRLEEHPNFQEGLCPVEGAVLANADVAVVTLPPRYREGGEPNLTIYGNLAAAGISIVTADKTVLALDYRGFTRRMMEAGLFLGYRATVAAGTPATDAALGLRLRGVERIRAVLNASTNYILGLVEKGLSFEEAVRESIRVKLSEPDPTVDTHGWDPAAKLVILAGILGLDVSVHDVERVPLDTVPEEEVRRAPGEGYRVKYVATADLREGTLRVAPERVPMDSPLARAEGEDNVIVFELEGTRVLLHGPAGPAWRTARVLMTDLLDYESHRRLAERAGGEGEV